MAAPAATIAPMRLLVADDEPRILDLFTEILAPQDDFFDGLDGLGGLGGLDGAAAASKEARFELTLCRQGEEAVAAVAEAGREHRPFAAAFLDVRMPPGRGGLVAAEAIRAMDPWIQIVVVTAFTDIDPATIASRVPPADKLLYIQKPFHPQEIRQFATSLGAKWRAERDFQALKNRLETRVSERTAALASANRRLTREMEERERVTKLIVAAKREWEGTFDSVQDMVVVIDRQCKVRRLNLAMAHRLGLPPKDVVGRECSFLFDLPDRPGERSDEILAMTDGRYHSREISIPRLRGEFLITASPLTHADDAPLGTVFVAHDVTERKNLEMRLRQSQKMEAIGTLAGGIAHDFNNILGIIMGFAEMIEAEAEQDGSLARRVDHILSACRRARDLVLQILTFSRQNDQEATPLHVGPLVKETLKLIRATVPNTIALVESIRPGRDTILAEPTQIQQILMNLCANAAHAMRETGGVLEVGLEEAPAGLCPIPGEANPGECLRLWVRDTGPGIGPDILERVFDPFFTTKKPGEGTGMGLSVAHGVVRKYHGDIKVKSDPGQGALFDVYLPLAQDAGKAATVPEPRPAMGRGRVLLVDDEEALAEIGRELIESLGYRARAETDPRQALAAIRDDPAAFDLLITDQNMPGMTGADLAREVLAVCPGLPVLMLTGFSETMSKEGARGIGIRDLLLKPILRRDLAAAIEAALREGGAGGGGDGGMPPAAGRG
ncbi:multi-sensor hybrid histidine kinase [Solidesulfovibrio carbinoliphilus subsp. oakridgensis]|uniref:histidine kinase n=1 Tax=Solidesulfovibrio carbinoliphilus subsp. oakridgensis TaxID=694327 RepID=G7QAS7_9BACT|nr:response regulator [Solidesulfovibrio carbinoliphilus]EHJ49308.1 multi-sensor hybrid histidine kinase [Solidesulfovibrio carbinoliphilus subsp. oakridgensis]